MKHKSLSSAALVLLALFCAPSTFAQVTILDAANESSGTFHSAISPSAGSNRWVYLVISQGTTTDLTIPSGVTLGGQAMTKLVGVEPTVNWGSATTCWALNEAGITAMSGTTVVISGNNEGQMPSGTAYLFVMDTNGDPISQGGNEYAASVTVP